MTTVKSTYNIACSVYNYILGAPSWTHTSAEITVLPSGNQPGLAGKSLTNGGFVRWEHHRTKWWIFQQTTFDCERVSPMVG